MLKRNLDEIKLLDNFNSFQSLHARITAIRGRKSLTEISDQNDCYFTSTRPVNNRTHKVLSYELHSTFVYHDMQAITIVLDTYVPFDFLLVLQLNADDICSKINEMFKVQMKLIISNIYSIVS